MDSGFSWVISNGGLDTEADYPYQAADGECNPKKLKRWVLQMRPPA